MRGDVTVEADIWTDAVSGFEDKREPSAKESRWPLATGKGLGNRFLPNASRRNTAQPTPSF